MEKSIKESDYVLIVCTPYYKSKSESISPTGVKFGDSIIRLERYMNRNERKFIPVLKEGEDHDAIPYQLQGKYYVDFREEASFFNQTFFQLINTIKNGNAPILEMEDGELLEEYQRTEDLIQFRVHIEWALNMVLSI